MVEQAIEAPRPDPEDAGELVAGTPPPAPGSQQPPPTPDEIMQGVAKFPPPSGGAPPAPTAEPTEQGMEVYTAAEIQAAAEEMKKLPPQVYIKMKEIVREGKQADLGEAGGIAWTTLWAESGAEFSVTSRATNTTNALDGLVAAIVHAGNKYKLSPIPRGSGGEAQAQVTNSPAGIETGMGDLNWISVDRNENDPSKLVVKFSVGKFKYPFQEHRGAKQALSLFDSAICEPRVQGGWSEAHFMTPGQRYEINGTLKVDWEHRGKYYNVLLVHP